MTTGPVRRLTPRQEEVAALVAKGKTNKQIATTLSVSENTVKAHIQAIGNLLGEPHELPAKSRLLLWLRQRGTPVIT